MSIKCKLVREIEEANYFFVPDNLVPSTETDVNTFSTEATRNLSEFWYLVC